MICIQCGAHNEDTISYCRQCGTNLLAIRSALLGSPPAPSQAMLPAVNPKLAPFVMILTALFGFLGFSVLFGAIIAVIALGADPSSHLAGGATVFLAALLAVTGTIGIVVVIRSLLKMVTAMATGASQQPPVNTGSRSLASGPEVVSLPPPRQPMSVVEHTTANLPNYANPRNTGE
jgi:hypothetical protein